MKYCLDSNVFIQGWSKYYSPEFSYGYWKIIGKLAKQGDLIIPRMVKNEIDKIEDDLKQWFESNQIPITEIDGDITNCLRKIYDADESHKRLVDSAKGRSIADPWVIATAMSKQAVVVTKEQKMTNPNSPRIRIPNVCDNMEIKWIDDFRLIKELNIKIKFELEP